MSAGGSRGLSSLFMGVAAAVLRGHGTGRRSSRSSLSKRCYYEPGVHGGAYPDDWQIAGADGFGFGFGFGFRSISCNI
jgi:hypothetical protein